VGRRAYRPGPAPGAGTAGEAGRSGDAPAHRRPARRRRTPPGVRETVQATLDLLRGLGVANLLSDDSPRRNPVLTAWKQQLAAPCKPRRDRPWWISPDSGRPRRRVGRG
jgi:hypothetical protein